MSEVIINIEKVSKEYRLGVVSTQTLRGDLQRWWAGLLGKEDPALIVGKTNSLSQKSDDEYIWALKDIDLEVRKGDVLGIIGKNGAGKSTLLKILSRVTAPTLGTIKIKGRIASLLEVGTGFHGELTGRENIFLNGAILGMTKREIHTKIDEIISFSGIEKYIDTPVKRYSSGMYVRLAFAVAAHLDPEILIVDEVLAVGDAEFHKKAIKKMKEVSIGEGRAVLFVSHNMSSIKHLCNKGIILSEGVVSFSGSTDEAIDRYLQLSTSFETARDFIISDDRRLKLHMPYWVNKENERVKFFTMGDKISLKFEIEFFDKFEAFNIGFAVIRTDGLRVFTSHLLDDPNYIKPKVYRGEMIIETEFGINTIAPGLYSVSFGIRDENENTILLSENELSLEIGQVNMKNAGYGVLWHTSNWYYKNKPLNV
jgi:lipopolysaccharide transport system ATP-binding protein